MVGHGKHVAYVRDDTIYVDGMQCTAANSPLGGRPSACRNSCPTSTSDLQPICRSPVARDSWLLGFTSLVDNVGLGPSIIEGVRPPGATRMTGTQPVLLTNGKSRTYRGRADPVHELAAAPPLAPDALRPFELRTLDGRTLVRDRKSGFCLADHWGIAPGWPNRKPHFLGDCEQFHPELRTCRWARRPASPIATPRSSTARTSTSPGCRQASTTSSTA